MEEPSNPIEPRCCEILFRPSFTFGHSRWLYGRTLPSADADNDEGNAKERRRLFNRVVL